MGVHHLKKGKTTIIIVQQKATVNIFIIGLPLKVNFDINGTVYKTVKTDVIKTVICFELDKSKNK